MEEESVHGIDRKSSIESEPRTLKFDQIQWARKEAMFVMSKAKSIEEALSVFTEGLEPMVQKKGERSMGTIGDHEHLRDDIHLPVIRDTASAPF